MKLTRSSANPILTPIDGSLWESRTVFNPGVAQLRGNDGKVIMIYRAQGHDNDVSRLGYAESSDGVHFTRSAEPIFAPSEPIEELGVEDPRLTLLDGRWQMLYTAWSPDNIQVALASTTDFRTWERHGVVIPGPDNKDAALFPRKVGGRYVMFHRIPPAIWLAFSDDMLHWGDYQQIIDPRPGHWDALKVGAGGPPLETPDGWLVIYHGVDRNKVYCLGVALLDKEDPSKVLNRPKEPILVPEEPWEFAGDVPNVVFTCGTAELGDDYLVYYGGADRVIGLATANKRDLLDYAANG